MANPSPSFPNRGSVQAVFVMTFTTAPLSGEALQSMVQVADSMLCGKNETFRSLMTAAVNPKTRIEVCNLQYGGPGLHTPQTMQTGMMGWLQRQYQVPFKPAVGRNFFPQGVRDPQGQPNYVLFYFHMV